MELINNTTKTLKDDLSVEIKQGSKVSIAAACFSMFKTAELLTRFGLPKKWDITKRQPEN